MNKKLVLGLLVVVIIFGGAHLYTKNLRANSVVVRPTEGQITPAGEGMLQYRDYKEWPLSFQYPSHWQVQEFVNNLEVVGYGGLNSIVLQGDGYVLKFHPVHGEEYLQGKNTIMLDYIVSGRRVKVFEEKIGDGFRQRIPICNGQVIDISSMASSKEATDKIIKSVTCSEVVG